MSCRAQVVGLQYYYLARITLAIHDPSLMQIGFAAHSARKRCDATVIDGIRHVLGLSVSNAEKNGAMFEASHLLKVCGGYLVEEGQQNAAVAYLRWLQQCMGWSTEKTIDELRRQWASDQHV